MSFLKPYRNRRRDALLIGTGIYIGAMITVALAALWAHFM